ncbi:MAG: iron ABC transporter permease [Synergistaceae bacterium]
MTEFFRKYTSKLLLPLFLLFLLFLSVVIATTLGSVQTKPSEVYSVILHHLFNLKNISDIPLVKQDVIFYLRLPRVILAMCTGAGLAVTGTVMQAIVKNPLADPYILGVSSGASLGATLSILLGLGTIFGENFIGTMAFLGAFITAFSVLCIANIGGKANSVKLLLAGIALSAICSAFSSFIIFFANNADGMQTITFWLMGSLAGAKWENIIIILPIVTLCVIFFYSQSRILNLMLLGDSTAITLGTNLNIYRHLYLLLSSLVIGFIVFSTGIIGFVGLIIPHACRIFVGTNHRNLIPTSAFVGAIFLIWTDVLSRVIIARGELPIGILVSMIGAPTFIYLMVKKTYGTRGE